MKEARHTHQFVDHYQGLIGFGLDRETDEKSLMVYLQKFSDDALLARIIPRLSEQEICELFDLISRLLKTHLQEDEYHRLFLKDADAENVSKELGSQTLVPFPKKSSISGTEQNER